MRAGLALVGNTKPFLAVVVDGSDDSDAVDDSATTDDDDSVTVEVAVVLLGDGVNK